MDPNQPANPVPPAKQPHLPISEAESHPEIYQDSPSGSKNTLLTLASLLVLAGIVGITLWLYIQNKTGTQVTYQSKKEGNKKSTPNNQQNQTDSVNNMKNKELISKYGAICKRFTILEEALRTPEIVCTLDLSGQSLKSLTKEIGQFKQLHTIILSNNNLEIFPKELYSLTSLISIDLKNNQLTENPDFKKLPNLQSIELSGNKISEKITIKRFPPLVIQY